jgi:hypothetical protein
LLFDVTCVLLVAPLSLFHWRIHWFRSDAIVNFDKRTIDLKIGPTKLEGIPWPVAKALSNSPVLIADILSWCFSTTRVLWIHLTADRDAKLCLGSLQEVSSELELQLWEGEGIAIRHGSGICPNSHGLEERSNCGDPETR